MYTLCFLQTMKSHKAYLTDQLRTSPESENAQWKNQLVESGCRYALHTSSAAFGSLPAPRRQSPRSAINSSYNLNDPNSAPNSAKILGARTRTERFESLSFSELIWPLYRNSHVRTTILLASSEKSQLYLKWKGAEKTKLLPVLQNSTSIIFFFKAFFFFLLLKECHLWLYIH